MWQKLRETDRYLNEARYPQLFYPESYLLEGGYKEFSSKYPQFCENNNNGTASCYVPMRCKEIGADYEFMLAT